MYPSGKERFGIGSVGHYTRFRVESWRGSCRVNPAVGRFLLVWEIMEQKIPSKNFEHDSGLECDAPETVQCLGIDSKHLVVRSVFSRDVQRYLPTELCPETLHMICGEAWLNEKFPAKSRAASSGLGFSPKDAKQYLIRCCQEAGEYDPSRERPEGVYLADDGQSLIINTNGVEVFRNDGSAPDGPDSKWVYIQVDKGLGISSSTVAASSQEVEEFVAFINSWNYGNPCDAMLIQGWWSMTALASALACRPHLCITGGRGKGKTRLNSTLGNLSGLASVLADGSSTEIGISQTLKGRAVPVYVDEAEQTAHGTVRGIVKMARTAYSGSGEGRLIGSGSGKGRSIRVVSPFMMACIRPPLFEASDASRWVVVEITGLKSTALQKPSKLLEEAYAEALGAKLRKLVLDRWLVFQSSLDLFRAAMLKQLNDGRLADTLAPILAGFWVLHHASPPKAAKAKQMAKKLGGSTLQLQEPVTDEEDCLQTLLTKSVPGQLIGERGKVSLVEVIRCAYLGSALADLQLQRRGMRVIRKGDGTAVLAVVVNAVHRELLTLFSNTRFAGGGWAPVLKRLKGAVPSTQKILRLATKVIEVPMADYLIDDTPQNQMGEAA